MGFKFKNKRRIKICSAGETLNDGGESIKFYEALNLRSSEILSKNFIIAKNILG